MMLKSCACSAKIYGGFLIFKKHHLYFPSSFHRPISLAACQELVSVIINICIHITLTKYALLLYL